MMRTIVESFKRLYEDGKITKEDVLKRKEKRLISQQETEYILSKTLKKQK